MLTTYFKSVPTLARYRSALVGHYLDEFILWLANRGYQRVSIRRHVRNVVHFAAWAASESLAIRELDHRALVRLHDHLNNPGLLLPLSGNQRQLYQSACVFTRFLGPIGVVRSVKQHSQSCAPALYNV